MQHAHTFLRSSHVLLFRLIALAIVVLLAAPPAAAQTAERCFPETGFCISGRIRQFWEQNGGLAIFGFPIGPQQEQTIEGKPVQAQNFERNRLELHPENTAPYDVLLGRLGADRLVQLGKDWQSYPKSEAQAGCRFFAETGQNVCGDILRAWRAGGLEIDGRRGKSESENLALFGLPLSPLVTERQADGQERQIQWFERARFELHPENQPPYHVLLGLLGNELRAGGNAPIPTPAPSGCGDIPTPTSVTVTPACVRGGDKLAIVARGLPPGDFIKLTLDAPDGKLYEFAIRYGDPAVRPDGTYVLDGALQPGVPPGRYTLTITGWKSGTAVVVPFGVTAGPPSGQDESAIPASVGGAQAYASPAMAKRGKAFFSFHTDGALPPNEEVGIYATRPDGQVFGAPFRLRTNRYGGVSGDLQFSTDTSDPYGLYATTFEVLTTGQKVIVYFRVVPEFD